MKIQETPIYQYTNLTMHKLKGNENPFSSAKKRVSYEDIYESRRKEIDKMSLNEIENFRLSLKKWAESLDGMLSEKSIEVPRRNYLIGLKKYVVNPLLNHTKQRRADMRRVISNGTPKVLAEHFVVKAAEQLPHEIFQRIYGAALTQVEIEETTIEQVKQFRQQSLSIAAKSGLEQHPIEAFTS